MDSTRLHRFRRDSAVAHFDLTDRDREIVRQVNRHRFLRSPQIIVLVGGSPQQVLRRLQLLYHHGYLERPQAQLQFFHQTGSRPMVYGLGNKGAALINLEGHAGPNPRSSEKNQKVGEVFLEHALLVSDVMVALELACRESNGIRLLWGDELPLSGEVKHPPRPFRWKISLKNGWKRGVIPDRVFALEYPNGERAFFFLEADRGTTPVIRSDMSQNSMYRKFLSYEATWSQLVLETQFGFHRFRVLTVTVSAGRVKSLANACRQLHQGHGLFLFADWKSLEQPGDILSSVWRTCAENKTVTLLN